MADQPSNLCTWTQDEWDGHWETSCKHAFCIDEGTPADNEMHFCCYCGKPLVALQFSEPELEEEEP
jgi:hypothetical protein